MNDLGVAGVSFFFFFFFGAGGVCGEDRAGAEGCGVRVHCGVCTRGRIAGPACGGMNGPVRLAVSRWEAVGSRWIVDLCVLTDIP